MSISIDKTHYDLIKAYARASYPEECCGFLLGNMLQGSKHVHATLPADNAREGGKRHNRFLIEPQHFLESEKYARERNLEIVGFYHSHPNAVAEPSEYDREHAWPSYSYVIVAVNKGDAGELTSWTLRDNREGFDSEEIVVLEKKGD